ncbi:acyl-CoA carboxylase subunit epsilon [Curtobacterium sp. RHCJP20]|uniref:Acyl-CoA carboxylase subunit epsilon n=1 Tax=Curtobacterium subtropicum TaxID=3055138 RepID=A0ABT7TGW4_9MICO|nr:acyl-CoA carboxylase subunit epsilon [Curtobacterium subtropicum]MDM7888820.1 acyl-CoA carboxylase subunit epsilon [Curtobacterium subtropicum]
MGRHAAHVPADAAVPEGTAASTPDGTTGPVVADVRVVAGDPSPEELAAVVAVLQRQADEAAALGRAEVTGSPRSGWDASARGLRRPIEHGYGAWSRSLR